MSQIRLYVDEDAAGNAVVAGLRRRGLDVLTAGNAGQKGLDDEHQLIWATNSGRVIYSFNIKHFAPLHTKFLNAGRSHAGMLLIPKQRYSIGEKIRRIVDFIDSTSAEEMIDQMVFL